MTLRYHYYYDDALTVRIRTKNVFPFFPAITKDLQGSDVTPQFAKDLLSVQGVSEVESAPYEIRIVKSHSVRFRNILNSIIVVLLNELGETDELEIRAPAGDRIGILDGPKKLKDTTI